MVLLYLWESEGRLRLETRPRAKEEEARTESEGKEDQEQSGGRVGPVRYRSEHQRRGWAEQT